MDSSRMDQEFRALVDFARGARIETGFGTMDAEGSVDPKSPVELWISARMTHVFALAQMYGIEGLEDYVEHGVNSLKRYFEDPLHGGWFASIESQPSADDKGIPVNDRKEAYAQAFVLLAATSAVAAGHDSAKPLLEEALHQQVTHWVEPSGLVCESWDRAFSEREDYRGINANMHTVEALLAAGDLLRDPQLVQRATQVLRFVRDRAEEHGWRVPEHYSAHWEVLPSYNHDAPAHPFRPFGVTPGHALELSRLMLHARASRTRLELPEEPWLLECAFNLGDRAVEDGWAVDGAPGFVYTTSFQGEPVVRQRMHWVACEAIGQALVLARTLRDQGDLEGSRRAEARAEEWWTYAEQSFVEEPGRWTHELNADNSKADGTWSGKPDVYHAAQMTLLTRLPTSPAFAVALSEGKLEQ